MTNFVSLINENKMKKQVQINFFRMERLPGCNEA